MNSLNEHHYGDGPIALHCLHGFGGSGQDFELLSHPKLSLHCLDLPGHGHSPALSSPCTERLVSVVNEWIPPAALLFGYSMGGRLALQAALSAPQQMRGLVLLGASPGISSADERSQRQAWDLRMATQLRKDGAGFWDDWERLPLLQSQQNIETAHLRKMRALRRRVDVMGPADIMEEFGSGTMPSVWHRLGELQCPVLLLVGERDHKYLEIAQRMLQRLPTAELQIIQAAGHCAHLEAPDIVQAELLRWAG